MPFERPALATLIERTVADAQTRLSPGQALLPVSNIAILARVLAGGVHGLYGYLDWIAAQVLPDTAAAEMLLRHAAVWGLEPLAATFATGLVTLSGSMGAIVPAATVLVRSDGARYRVVADTEIGGTWTVSVQAEAVGDAGDTAAGTALTLASAVSGVNAAGVVAAGGITGGNAQESIEALRARLLARIRQPPQGGCAADYVAWAMGAHPEVTRAWAFPLEAGAGTVTVRVMTDGATVDGIPSPTVVAAVAAAIAPVRPVTARVIVVAPVAAALTFALSAVPASLAVRAAIEAGLADLIRREAVPGGTLLLSHIRAEISAAAGESDYQLSSPAANVVAATGYISTFGGVTWS